MTVFCFDTDMISAVMGPVPPMHLVRRLARTPVAEQCTTAITLGEILYGAARVGKGLGIHFAVADLNADGRLDIVAPGKDGLYVFFNEGCT